MNFAVALYAFPRARIGALRSSFLTGDDFRALLEAESTDDIVSLLKLSAYGEELSRMRSPGTGEVEELLRRSLTRDYGKVYSSLYGFGKIFIERVTKKFEVQALKGAIQETISGPGEHRVQILPFGSIGATLIERIQRSESYEEMAESLRLTEYYQTFQEALPRIKSNGGLFALFSRLDKHVYDRMGGKLRAIHGLDKRISRLLVGTEIDFKNMMLMLRCRNAEDDEVAKLLIDYRYNLDDTALKALREEGVEVLSQEGFPYGMVVEGTLEEYKKTKSLLPFETALRKHLMSLNLIALTGFPFQLGAVIAYLNMKENEITNLTILLRGKKEGLGREEIEGLLVAPQKILK